MKNKINKILLLGLMVAMLVLNTGCMTVINEGEAGIRKVWGNYDEEELTTGFKLYNPISTNIYKVNTKLLNIEEKISVPSSEGLIIATDVSVIFRVRQDMASELKKEVSGDVTNTLIIPNLRNALRDIASGYEAKAMYSQESRTEISSKLKAQLSEKLSKYIEVQDVLLRDVVLPARVTEAIELKIDSEQKAQAKEFELQSAEKDAEIEIARARGIAEANRIISDSISDNYIRYKFVEGLNDGNTEVIYVPTETNLPILEAGRGS